MILQILPRLSSPPHANKRPLPYTLLPYSDKICAYCLQLHKLRMHTETRDYIKKFLVVIFSVHFPHMEMNCGAFPL